ncbi:hypothetical protein BDN70DRAFT_933241 [Pholiota conissans]|uniref:Uncharacterized protein n=1 Tax=Pholiota conissans TaxID=109636 RepID=A0A9P6CZT4_9AGAR|nr:hypothetical protein BDN70DRAFT_933241 [Pholiota conissans]
MASSTEDDIGRPHFVRFDDDYTPTQASSKGKERQTSPSPAPSDEPDTVAYPPTTENAEETRRVEENLRRWEIAERQRRKAARGSSTSTASASLVSDVSRRASLLWSGRKSRGASLGGVGTHTALQSTDNVDTLPLTHINNSPTPSPTHSSFDEAGSSTNNPFAAPADSLTSPFADSQKIDPIRLHPNPAKRAPTPTSNNNTLQHSRSLSNSTAQSPPPPPQPLGLPPPRTPPPIIPSPSDSTPSLDDRDKETKEVRWWHDWLCGCGEGPDRGGRTNKSLRIEIQDGNICLFAVDFLTPRGHYQLASPAS